MRFCKKCGNLMVVERKGKKVYLVCKKCHKKEQLKGDKVKITEAIHEPKKEALIMGKSDEAGELPKTKIMCPKCGNMEAYWWMQQTRGDDEPPTIFYKCTKCGYSWRSYG
ncbi:MAG: transcription factor S [Candidatus Heimdallarchaeota archaeon]